ncbi:MAG: aminopeptidase P family protein [Phycisphaerae bacterium]|nr:aminopeptidase P family protein [Phycisphaerae bacterium]
MAKRKSRGPAPHHRRRLSVCRAAMRKAKLPGLLITNPRDYLYLTGFTGEDSAVLITARDVHMISDGRFDETLNQECPWAKRWMRKGLLIPEIATVSRKSGLRRVGIQGDHLTVQELQELSRLNRGTRFEDAPPISRDMRLIKSPEELKVIRKAIRVAEEAFQATRESIQIGQTELEVAARVEYEMKRRGASEPSFGTICAEGPNAALPHAHPGKRKLRKGSALLLDWGARVDGYCSDLTRMLFVGSISARIREIYKLVLDAQLKAIEAIRPGARMCDVDAVARDHIAGAGYREAFNHGLGHGFGLDIHESPSLSWRSDQELREGMVVTVEPGIYLPGVGGVRIEDDILVTPRGYKVLTSLSKSLEEAVL